MVNKFQISKYSNFPDLLSHSRPQHKCKLHHLNRRHIKLDFRRHIHHTFLLLLASFILHEHGHWSWLRLRHQQMFGDVGKFSWQGNYLLIGVDRIDTIELTG